MTTSYSVLVQSALNRQGLETPRTDEEWDDTIDQKQCIGAHFARVMSDGLGLNLKDDSLQDTPQRVAKMYVDEIFSGLSYNNFPKITLVDNKFGYKDDLIESGIQVYSTCEHHFLPIIGEAVVAYKPRDQVLGLSKLNRIVDFFSRRPQVQERLTMQIGVALQTILGHEDVYVMIKASHMCVKLRGIQDPCCDTTTYFRKGVYEGRTL